MPGRGGPGRLGWSRSWASWSPLRRAPMHRGHAADPSLNASVAEVGLARGAAGVCRVHGRGRHHVARDEAPR